MSTINLPSNTDKHQTHEGLLKPYLTTSNVYWNCFDFTEVKEMFFKNSELDRSFDKRCSFEWMIYISGGDFSTRQQAALLEMTV